MRTVPMAVVCPYCGSTFNVVSGKAQRMPTDGDNCLCWTCRKVSKFVFSDVFGLALRQPDASEKDRREAMVEATGLPEIVAHAATVKEAIDEWGDRS